MKARNIMEDIVVKYLDEMLAMRFDICTCATCREDMLAYVLTRIPARYVTTDSGAMHAMVDQIRVEESSVILREIVTAIKNISENPRHEGREDLEKAYGLLIKQIKAERGVDFSQYRDRVLKRRIALRMRAHNVRTYAEYLQLLMHKPEEYDQLFDVLTINVSSFFRDTHVWDKLRQDIFPAIIEKKKHSVVKKIRIWSAGCSHGEEPYSLAMMLYELLEKDNFSIKAEIFASDIDRECLKQATAGRYDANAVKSLSAHHLKRFFIKVGDMYQVVPHIKEMVHVKDLNLIHDAGIPGVDMVVCRNVFIYFNRSLQEYLIMKFHTALEEKGYFVMGNSETMLGEARHVFDQVDSLCRIYQKRPKPSVLS